MEFKKLKKITSILLAVILVFGIAATGFAASPEDVVVEEVTAEAVAQTVAEEPAAPAAEEPAATVQATTNDIVVTGTVVDTSTAAPLPAGITAASFEVVDVTTTTIVPVAATVDSFTNATGAYQFTIAAANATAGNKYALRLKSTSLEGRQYAMQTAPELAVVDQVAAQPAGVFNITSTANATVTLRVTGGNSVIPFVDVNVDGISPFMTSTEETNANGLVIFTPKVAGVIGTVTFKVAGGNFVDGYYLDSELTTTLLPSATPVNFPLTAAPTKEQISISGLANRTVADTTPANTTLFTAKASSAVTGVDYLYKWEYLLPGALSVWTPVPAAEIVDLADGSTTLKNSTAIAGNAIFVNNAQFRLSAQPKLTTTGVYTTFSSDRPFATSGLVNFSTVVGHKIKGTISNGVIGITGVNPTKINVYDKALYVAGTKTAVGNVTVTGAEFEVTNVPNGNYVIVLDDIDGPPAYKGTSKEVVVNFTQSTAQTLSGVVLNVTAADAIKISAQPQNVTLNENDPAPTFSATATRTDGETDFNYQWQLSKDGGKTYTDIAGAASPPAGAAAITPYPVPTNVTAAMNGNMYRVKIVAGTFTTYTDAAILRVRAFAPVTSVSIPASLESVVGRSLEIKPTVRGTSPTYTWFIKRGDTANWSQIPNSAPFAVDSTTGKLTIAAGTIQATWAGYQFKLEASNITPASNPQVTNKVESNASTLAIVPATPISIKTDVKDVTGIINRQAVFSVELAGTAPYMVAWQYSVNGGATWLPSTLSNTESTTAVNTFSVPGALGVGSAGQVLARARIQNKELTQTVWSSIGTLTSVSNAVTLGFAKNPTSQDVVAGREFELDATASGSAPFYYRWQKKAATDTVWSDVAGAAWTTESKFEAATAVSISDSGTQYRALVTSDTATVGALPTGDTVVASTTVAASTPATITVVPFEALSIKTQPADAIAAADATAKFSVEAAGSAPYTYLWMVSKDKGATYTEISDSNVATYETAKLTADMEGWMYKVVVSNEEGDEVTSSAATLSVISGIHITGPTSVYPGEKLQLEAVLTPETSTAKVVWSIAAVNADKASVDQNGLVTAKDNGILNVTATVEGTDIKASYKIRISDKLYVNGGGERPWFTQLPIGPTATVKTSSNAITVDDRKIVKVNRRAKNGQRVTVTATYPNTRTTTWSFTLVVVK